MRSICVLTRLHRIWASLLPLKCTVLPKQPPENQTVGNPAEDGDHIGLCSTKYCVIPGAGHDTKGIDEGARLLAGGTGRPDGQDKGWFVKPTIFADVSNDMAIALQQEIFGPVLVIIPFEDEAEAIRIANDTPYGLAALSANR